MIALFLNLHKQDAEGKAKFQRYYKEITKILKQSIYFGTHYEEFIRTKDDVGDFLYDDLELSNREKAKQKFKSVLYIFIDGPLSMPPWSPSLSNISLLIRNSLRENKKIHFNGYGHIAIYYFLCTGFDKDYCIRKKGENVTGKEDYLHQQQTGDLYAHGKMVCNSGIHVVRSSQRAFQNKSVQALDKGTVLPTKFHFLAFNSKNGDSLIKNVIFPFTFFQKHKVFCVPLVKTRAHVVSIVETQDRIPIVFSYKNSLSTHLLCPQTIKIFTNWITNGQQVKPFRQIKIENSNMSQVAFDNLLVTKSCKNYTNSSSGYSFIESNRKTLGMRPQTASSSKSKFNFDKPSVRCSGPYQSVDQIKQRQQIQNKNKLLGRSRMFFKSEMDKNQIQNYVQRTPSRPPSAYNFRQVNKAKWIDKKTFFVT